MPKESPEYEQSELPSRMARSYAPISDINVTPFVDVMLVLLIVFMVTAPLLVSGIDIELPEAGEEPLQLEDDPLTISVTREGLVFLQDAEVAWTDLPERFAQIAENDEEQRIYIRGDSGVDYGRVMEIIGALQDSGLNRIGLVSLPASEEEGI